MCSLFSLGYSNKSIDDFKKIVKDNGINCLVDVRSTPYSKQFAEFNRENLKAELNECGVKYLFFGKEFGARREEDNLYSTVVDFNGEEKCVVDFLKVHGCEEFLNGVKRVEDGIKKGYRICFLCSEKRPYDCHRAIMVSDWFHKHGYEINHIIDDKERITHSEMLKLPLFKEYFLKCKKSFYDKYNDVIAYNGVVDLFTGKAKSAPQFVSWWDNFFKEYNIEKAMMLINLKIGYKKGDLIND